MLGDIAEALRYLHGRAPAVVHRDIKPGNIIRRSDGSYTLVDFGAVRDRLKPEGGSTVVGTFGYMAPEQFPGPRVDTLRSLRPRRDRPRHAHGHRARRSAARRAAHRRRARPPLEHASLARAGAREDARSRSRSAHRHHRRGARDPPRGARPTAAGTLRAAARADRRRARSAAHEAAAARGSAPRSPAKEGARTRSAPADDPAAGRPDGSARRVARGVARRGARDPAPHDSLVDLRCFAAARRDGHPARDDAQSARARARLGMALRPIARPTTRRRHAFASRRTNAACASATNPRRWRSTRSPRKNRARARKPARARVRSPENPRRSAPDRVVYPLHHLSHAPCPFRADGNQLRDPRRLARQDRDRLHGAGECPAYRESTCRTWSWPGSRWPSARRFAHMPTAPCSG